MPREVFVAGQILTAAEMNTVSDQTVMSFAGTAARGSAIPSPVEGMAAYLEDSNILSLYDGSAWKNSLGVTGGILQVVSTTKTDAFSTTSASFVDVTGLSVTITPSSATSKILVLSNLNIGRQNEDSYPHALLLRGSTAINQGDALSSATQATIGASTGLTTASFEISVGHVFLDSPNTTSSVTYKWQVNAFVGRTTYVNRTANTSADTYTGASNITVMEVAA